MSVTTKTLPRRLMVWGATKAELSTLVTREGWNRAKIEAAHNGHGYWVYQPGSAKSFNGFQRVFMSDFREVTVTEGYGSEAHKVTKVLAYAKAGQQ